MAWRAFSATPAFHQGIQHLRFNHAPRTRGAATVPDLIEKCLGQSAYNEALDDLSEVLLVIEKTAASLDEPPLQA